MNNFFVIEFIIHLKVYNTADLNVEEGLHIGISSKHPMIEHNLNRPDCALPCIASWIGNSEPIYFFLQQNWA